MKWHTVATSDLEECVYITRYESQVHFGEGSDELCIQSVPLEYN